MALLFHITIGRGTRCGFDWRPGEGMEISMCAGLKNLFIPTHERWDSHAAIVLHGRSIDFYIIDSFIRAHP